jgi:hypothetical protein
VAGLQRNCLGNAFLCDRQFGAARHCLQAHRDADLAGQVRSSKRSV